MLEKIKYAFRVLLNKPEPCQHDWRPIVAQLHGWNERKPARQCLWCKEWQPLTDEQFYAQFGEHFYSYAQASRKP